MRQTKELLYTKQNSEKKLKMFVNILTKPPGFISMNPDMNKSF